MELDERVEILHHILSHFVASMLRGDVVAMKRFHKGLVNVMEQAERSASLHAELLRQGEQQQLQMEGFDSQDA